MEKLILVFFLLLFSISETYSQSARRLNREGIEEYKKGEFKESERLYKKALEESANLIEASYNIGLSYYKQENYTQALNQFKKTLSKTEDKDFSAKLHHNIGNTYLQLNKLKESVESYQNSLRLNPNDNETRYNLSYALMKLKARQKNNEKDTKDLLNQIEQEENFSQRFMRRNKNMGKEVKNW